jgi:WD40 repeat protein
MEKGNWKRADHEDLECKGKVESLAIAQSTLVAGNCGALYFWTPPSTKSVQRETDCPSLSLLTLSGDGKRIAYVCKSDQGWTIRTREAADRQGFPISKPNVLLVFNKENKERSDKSSVASGSPNQSLRALYPFAETWSAPGDVEAMQFDPKDSRILVIGGRDGAVRSKLLEPLNGNVPQSSAPWDRKRGQFIVAEGKGTALYRPPQGDTLLTLPASTDIISFSEDGNWIAVAESDHIAKIWDTKEILPRRLIAHLALDRPIKSLAISRAGKHIVAITDEGDVHLWRLDRSPTDFSDKSLLQAHGSYVITHGAGDGSIFSGSAQIVDTRTGRLVASFPNPHEDNNRKYQPLAISRDGTLIAGIDEKDGVVVSEFSDGKIGKRKFQSGFPEANIYTTSFGFSFDDRFWQAPLAIPRIPIRSGFRCGI